MAKQHSVQQHWSGKYRYPFAQMNVGDYFMITGVPSCRAASIGACAAYHTKQTGRKFKREQVAYKIYRFERIA